MDYLMLVVFWRLNIFVRCAAGGRDEETYSLTLDIGSLPTTCGDLRFATRGSTSRWMLGAGCGESIAFIGWDKGTAISSKDKSGKY